MIYIYIYIYIYITSREPLTGFHGRRSLLYSPNQPFLRGVLISPTGIQQPSQYMFMLWWP